jgi:hypothetical protein
MKKKTSLLGLSAIFGMIFAVCAFLSCELGLESGLGDKVALPVETVTVEVKLPGDTIYITPPPEDKFTSIKTHITKRTPRH